MTEAKPSTPSWKRMILPGLAVLALVFAGAGYYGNFLQWSDAVETEARILNAEKQWSRRGAGNINLDIQYVVDEAGTPKSRNGTVSVGASTLQEAGTEDRIVVYYRKKDPGRVIPVAVLEKKQRAVIIAAVAGLALGGIAILLRFRR